MAGPISQYCPSHVCGSLIKELGWLKEFRGTGTECTLLIYHVISTHRWTCTWTPRRPPTAGASSASLEEFQAQDPARHVKLLCWPNESGSRLTCRDPRFWAARDQPRTLFICSTEYMHNLCLRKAWEELRVRFPACPRSGRGKCNSSSCSVN